MVLPCWLCAEHSSELELLRKLQERTRRVLEIGKNLHSENKKLTKGRTQEPDEKERVMVKKKKKEKPKKTVFARGLMAIIKCLYQEQEKDISVNENAKLDCPSPDFLMIQRRKELSILKRICKTQR